MGQGSIYVCMYVCGHTTVPAAFAEKTILSPLNYLITFVKNQLPIYFSGLSTLFH